MPSYRSQVIDVPIVGLDQSNPEHGGPEGRVTVLKDAQVTHYTPGEPGVPQKVRIEPREAFVSMPSELRSSASGAVSGAGWNNPRVLEALGDQLLAICDSNPRVYNGSTWTAYTGTRVVTNKLSQDILHTTSHVLQAPDCARIGNVTCFAWIEVTPNPAGIQYQPTVAFRADDGAWIRTPFNLFSNPPASAPTLARVVSDGTLFWVFAPIGSVGKIGIWVYDTHGAQIATDTATVPLKWAVSPGYWDVCSSLPVAWASKVLLIQPTSNTTTGANVGASYWALSVAGSAINLDDSGSVTGGVGAAKCTGPLAFMAPGGFNAIYFASVGIAGALWAYELTPGGVPTHEYNFGAVIGGSGIPDSLTGWAAPGSGVTANVAFSVLSNFTPPAGPKNDPGLRYVRSYACTAAGAVSLTNQTNGVLLSSRAVQIDQSWYAAAYYQSGAGLARTGSVGTIPFTIDDATDYLLGAAVQPLDVRQFDLVIGSQQRVNSTGTELFASTTPKTIISIVPSQAIATITHNAGDSAVAASNTWTLLNATFQNVSGLSPPPASAFNSYLRISGSSHAANNADFRVYNVISGTQVQTESVSTTGTTMVDDTLVGVTATLVSTTTVAVTNGEIGSMVPGGAEDYFKGQVFTSGFYQHPANNALYTCFRVLANTAFPNWTGAAQFHTMFLCTPVAGNVAEGSINTCLVVFTPTNANNWGFSGVDFTTQDISNYLSVVGTPHNDGNYLITAKGGMSGSLGIYNTAITALATSNVPQVMLPPLPTVSIVLADPTQAYRLHIALATFDASWKGAYITFSGLNNAATDGLYQVTSVLSATDLQLAPVDGRVGQRNDDGLHGASISVTKTNNVPSAAQPCWYLMPLSISQRVAGRWDWGQAFADWRYDGEAKANAGTFERNGLPLALSSVVASADGVQLVLPYRAQSFTAGQVQDSTQTQTGLSLSAQSTIGLKMFNISAQSGQAVPGQGDMLLPGMQATQFGANAFPEDGVNLGFEAPFLVSTGVAGTTLALTLNATYQYVAVIEQMTETGDRIWSTVSQALEVTLRGTANQVTLGGRMPGPTNRIVGVSLYRVAMIGGTPSVQHYKITNDLDVNGAGFSFTTINGGAQLDTWQFVDTVPDAQITSSEVVYTDKSLLQRFPAPAYSQGVSGWKARDWLVGYDGAVWMSGEKVEGDATWYHPAFRYTAFGDDRPVSVCPMDDYLIVHCQRSVWYIPAATFPDATGRNGGLPNPVQLPMQNGGTGFALAIREGVVYSSTAGGVWLITRGLQNLWLSEAVRDSLVTVRGMTIDGKQRLWVSTGTTSMWVYDQITKTWWEWTVPQSGAPSLVSTFAGQGAYIFGSSPVLYTPNAYLDNIDGVTSGIAIDVTFATLEFGAVRSYKCLWACQIVGVYKGLHRLNAIMSYPDEDGQAATTFAPFVPDPSKPYIYEINPMVEEASVYSLRIFVDFVGVATPGNSCQIELLSFEVGVEGGINRIPATRRIRGS